MCRNSFSVNNWILIMLSINPNPWGEGIQCKKHLRLAQLLTLLQNTKQICTFKTSICNLWSTNVVGSHRPDFKNIDLILKSDSQVLTAAIYNIYLLFGVTDSVCLLKASALTTLMLTYGAYVSPYNLQQHLWLPQRLLPALYQSHENILWQLMSHPFNNWRITVPNCFTTAIFWHSSQTCEIYGEMKTCKNGNPWQGCPDGDMLRRR